MTKSTFGPDFFLKVGLKLLVANTTGKFESFLEDERYVKAQGFLKLGVLYSKFEKNF